MATTTKQSIPTIKDVGAYVINITSSSSLYSIATQIHRIIGFHYNPIGGFIQNNTTLDSVNSNMATLICDKVIIKANSYITDSVKFGYDSTQMNGVILFNNDIVLKRNAFASYYIIKHIDELNPTFKNAITSNAFLFYVFDATLPVKFSDSSYSIVKSIFIMYYDKNATLNPTKYIYIIGLNSLFNNYIIGLNSLFDN